MVKYLIRRPIAVLMSFLVLLMAGILVAGKVPVSLLPNIDVPQIVIRVNYPNASALILEQNIVRPIREGLLNMDKLKNIETQTANHTALLHLHFEYDAKMNLVFVNVNEKLDQLMAALPRDMPRPQIMRVNTSDIPVVRIQVVPKENTSYTEVSALVQKTLKKRLEQLEGVSLVDINGMQQGIIAIIPDKDALEALGLTEREIIQPIQFTNHNLGSLSIKDGQYRYQVKLVNLPENEAAISRLPITLKDGTSIPLNRVAKVVQEPEAPMGYHLFNGKEGLVLTVQKRPGSRMNELVPEIERLVTLFRSDYKQVEFAITQDQTFLLDAGIDNLKQDIFYGGLLTILLLFLFLGNIASPLLMSISIPLSLLITFLFFYLFNISFNIISLSGLALGIGMLIDNSIVVIDNITRKRQGGLDMDESSIQGTNEVIVPVISQVLTTVAVYAPLVLLSGIAGALVLDQGIGLTISLAVSLLVAFILSPLLYKLFLRTDPGKLKKDTHVYIWVAQGYHRMIHHILKHKLVYFLLTIMIMPVGVWLASQMSVTALPALEKKESLLRIDWNDAVDAGENLHRVKLLQTVIQPGCLVTEAEVGLKQFLLQQDNTSIQKAEVYFSCLQEQLKQETDSLARNWIQQNYPQAIVQIFDAPNAFTQLFQSPMPYLEARFKPANQNGQADPFASIPEMLHRITPGNYSLGTGFVDEPSIAISLDFNKMAIYGVDKTIIEDVLKQQFGVYTISEIKQLGETKTIRLKTDRTTLDARLASTVINQNGTHYPLHYFLSYNNDRQQKFITADKSGEYKSIYYDETSSNIPLIQSQLTRLAANYGFSVEFTGQYFENRQQLKQLWYIFLLVLLLLYFILAIQYEDLLQPLVVMLTIPLGITGGMLLLWLTGGTLNVMASIGFIVVLGLIVDDPILKIETLNRLENKYREAGMIHDDKLLEQMIHEAGTICLKPLLMVSLTTSIALVPVLFVGGIGNDLQKPMALVIIGGLTLGTFFTTWFIPLAYWYLAKWRNRLK